jgi:hypothetical protein
MHITSDAADIAALEQAAALVKAHAPSAFEADVREIVRRMGWILAGFATSRVCKHCAHVFEVDAVEATRYAVGRMPLPSTCPRCRR